MMQALRGHHDAAFVEDTKRDCPRMVEPESLPSEMGLVRRVAKSTFLCFTGLGHG